MKVPDKLSEVFGDVLELACRGGGAGQDKDGSGSASAAGIKIGAVTGVAIIRGRWAQRGSRSPLSSVNTNDSADSTTSGTSSEVTNGARWFSDKRFVRQLFFFFAVTGFVAV